MGALRSWWGERSPRERRLLIFMLVLVAAVFLKFLIIRPLTTYVASAQTRLEAAERLRARAFAATQSAMPAGKALSPLPLAERITQSASEAGFELTRNERDATGATQIEIGFVRAPALYAWLAKLEEQGVVVRTLRLTTRSDATLGASLTLGEGR
jgi:general secretion pathway protein M